MNGSCNLWVNCANDLANGSNSSGDRYPQHGVCCSESEWIGTTSNSEGMEPFDSTWRIGTFMAVLWWMRAASVLVTSTSSMTRFAAVVHPYVVRATTWCMSWLSSYPMTSMVVFGFMVFLLYFGYVKMNKKVKLKSRSHLGPCRGRRWKGDLRARWQGHLRLLGLIFMVLLPVGWGNGCPTSW